jgi:hypothetical protein
MSLWNFSEKKHSNKQKDYGISRTRDTVISFWTFESLELKSSAIDKNFSRGLWDFPKKHSTANVDEIFS